MNNPLACLSRIALLALAAMILVACGDAENEGVALGPSDAGAAPDIDAAADCVGPGCACDGTIASKTCRPAPLVSEEGTSVCIQGTMYCRAGTWSSCETLAGFDLSGVGATNTQQGVAGILSALITDASTCDDCHPDCFRATDKPEGSELTTSNSKDVDFDPDAGGIRPHILVNPSQRGTVNSTAVCGNKLYEPVGVNGGAEECDDGNTTPLDGCDALCRLEKDKNWFCPTPGMSCKVGVCGNATKEGSEPCDDGNKIVGDGCGPDCTVEPTCPVGGACSSTCGDGILLPGDPVEKCDDGNTRSNDGCSQTCQIEYGFTCTQVGGTLPASFPITVTYRDFIRNTVAGSGASKHPDFEVFSGSFASTGIVKDTLENGKPAYTGACEQGRTLPSTCSGAQTTTKANFDQWYSSTEINNVVKIFSKTMTMNRQGTTSSYRNSTFGNQLFPLDGEGWPTTTPVKESLSAAHNFSFTTEIHYWWQFKGNEVLTFSGDDDVWVFIADKLALDLGGLHSKLNRTISMNALGQVACYEGTSASGTSCGTRNLGLTVGNVYEMTLFHAERRTNQSNFDLTLNGFVATRSNCVSTCGDAKLASDEFCDDGAALNGLAGYCFTNCSGRAAKYVGTSSYWRDYSAIGTCTIPPERPRWGDLTWSGNSTGGSIVFELRGSETQAGLATAQVVSVPVGVNQTGGAFNVRTRLAAAGVQDDPPYLRVTAVLNAAADLKSAPVLSQFDVTHTCVNVE